MIIYTFSFYVLFLYDDKLSVSDIVFEEEVLGTERKQEEWVSRSLITNAKETVIKRRTHFCMLRIVV